MAKYKSRFQGQVIDATLQAVINNPLLIIESEVQVEF